MPDLDLPSMAAAPLAQPRQIGFVSVEAKEMHRNVLALRLQSCASPERHDRSASRPRLIACGIGRPEIAPLHRCSDARDNAIAQLVAVQRLRYIAQELRSMGRSKRRGNAMDRGELVIGQSDWGHRRWPHCQRHSQRYAGGAMTLSCLWMNWIP
jgi:hypothetical protein